MTQQCKSINAHTLVMYGEFDEAQRSVVQPWLDCIPHVQQGYLSNASHMALLEYPDAYIKIVSDFLAH